MRRELFKFSEECEIILLENDHKPHWSRDCTPEFLMYKLANQIVKLSEADTKDKSEIRKRAVNISNYAMMLWDKSSNIEESSDGKN